NWDSTATALLALYCAVRLLETNAARWGLSCGFFAGVTVMIEQSKGAGLVLGLGIAALLLHRVRSAHWNRRHLLAAMLGAALPVSIVCVYFAAHHALTPMLQGWLWPLRHYVAVNQRPYGYIEGSATLREMALSSGWIIRFFTLLSVSPMMTAALLPLLVLTLAGTIAAKILLGKVQPTPLMKLIILVGAVLLGEFLATWATGRHDSLRMVFLAPLFFFVVPLLLDPRLVRLPALSNARPLVALFLLLSFATVGLVRWPVNAHEISTRRGVLKTEMPEGVLPYLQAHVAPGSKLLTYPYLPLYSFVSGTFSPTRFEYLHAGMHTPA